MVSALLIQSTLLATQRKTWCLQRQGLERHSSETFPKSVQKCAVKVGSDVTTDLQSRLIRVRVRMFLVGILDFGAFWNIAVQSAPNEFSKKILKGCEG